MMEFTAHKGELVPRPATATQEPIFRSRHGSLYTVQDQVQKNAPVFILTRQDLRDLGPSHVAEVLKNGFGWSDPYLWSREFGKAPIIWYRKCVIFCGDKRGDNTLSLGIEELRSMFLSLETSSIVARYTWPARTFGQNHITYLSPSNNGCYVIVPSDQESPLPDIDLKCPQALVSLTSGSCGYFLPQKKRLTLCVEGRTVTLQYSEVWKYIKEFSDVT